MGLNVSRVKLKTIKVTINTNKSNSKYQESKRLIVMFKSLLSGLFAAAIKTVGAEKSTAFHKSWTYFITKLYPFTSHGHTLSQSCILSQVMDILYHKVESSTPCCGQEANSTSVCIGRYSSNYLAIVASMTPD